MFNKIIISILIFAFTCQGALPAYALNNNAKNLRPTVIEGNGNAIGAISKEFVEASARGTGILPAFTPDELYTWLQNLSPDNTNLWHLYGGLKQLPETELRHVCQTVSKAYFVSKKEIPRAIKYLLKERGRGTRKTILKHDETVVTKPEINVQNGINGIARKKIPGIVIIGEENKDVKIRGMKWFLFVDPVDNTDVYYQPNLGNNYSTNITMAYQDDNGIVYPVMTVMVAPQYDKGKPIYMVTGLGINGVLFNGKTISKLETQPSLFNMVAGLYHYGGRATKAIQTREYRGFLKQHALRVATSQFMPFDLPRSIKNRKFPGIMMVGEWHPWDIAPAYHIISAFGTVMTLDGADFTLADHNLLTQTMFYPNSTRGTRGPKLIFSTSKLAANQLLHYYQQFNPHYSESLALINNRLTTIDIEAIAQSAYTNLLTSKDRDVNRLTSATIDWIAEQTMRAQDRIAVCDIITQLIDENENRSVVMERRFSSFLPAAIQVGFINKMHVLKPESSAAATGRPQEAIEAALAAYETDLYEKKDDVRFRKLYPDLNPQSAWLNQQDEIEIDILTALKAITENELKAARNPDSSKSLIRDIEVIKRELRLTIIDLDTATSITGVDPQNLRQPLLKQIRILTAELRAAYGWQPQRDIQIIQRELNEVNEKDIRPHYSPGKGGPYGFTRSDTERIARQFHSGQTINITSLQFQRICLEEELYVARQIASKQKLMSAQRPPQTPQAAPPAASKAVPIARPTPTISSTISRATTAKSTTAPTPQPEPASKSPAAQTVETLYGIATGELIKDILDQNRKTSSDIEYISIPASTSKTSKAKETYYITFKDDHTYSFQKNSVSTGKFVPFFIYNSLERAAFTGPVHINRAALMNEAYHLDLELILSKHLTLVINTLKQRGISKSAFHSGGIYVWISQGIGTGVLHTGTREEAGKREHIFRPPSTSAKAAGKTYRGEEAADIIINAVKQTKQPFRIITISSTGFRNPNPSTAEAINMLKTPDDNATLTVTEDDNCTVFTIKAERIKITQLVRPPKNNSAANAIGLFDIRTPSEISDLLIDVSAKLIKKEAIEHSLTEAKWHTESTEILIDGVKITPEFEKNLLQEIQTLRAERVKLASLQELRSEEYRWHVTNKKVIIIDENPIRREEVRKFIVQRMGFSSTNGTNVYEANSLEEALSLGIKPDLVINNSGASEDLIAVTLQLDTESVISMLNVSTIKDENNNKRLIENWIRDRILMTQL